ALALVPRGSVEEGRLLASYGWFSGVADADDEAAQRAFQRALAIAGRQGDLALERRTLAYAAFADAFHLHWPDSLDKGLRAMELPQKAGDLPSEMTARRAIAWALTAIGDGEQARFHAAAALAHAEKVRERWWLASTSFTQAVLSLYAGDWQDVRELGDLGLAAQPRDPRHLGVRLVLEFEQGAYAEGRAYIERLQEVSR